MAYLKLLKEYSQALKEIFHGRNKAKMFTAFKTYRVGDPKRDPDTKLVKKDKFNVSMNMLIIMLAMLAVVVIAGCSDDNPVNNGNPPPTGNWAQIFFIDSVSIWVLPNSGNNIDTIIPTLQIADTLKIEFELRTNCNTDSANTQPGLIIYSRDSASTLLGYTVNNTSQMNQSHTAYLPANGTVFLKIEMGIVNFTSQNKFLKIQNIKVFKL